LRGWGAVGFRPVSNVFVSRRKGVESLVAIGGFGYETDAARENASAALEKHSNAVEKRRQIHALPANVRTLSAMFQLRNANNDDPA
jgi:hypothetical protein